MTRPGNLTIERALALARHSDSPDHYTRLLYSPAHRAASAQIQAWMREAGMTVRVDSVGNVIGRYEAATKGAKTLLFGSHFDSVRNGGKFDGNLGILAPIECVAEMNARGERAAVAVEIAAFSDEEGARFATGFLSSKSLVGQFDRAWLDRCDAAGVSLRDAMRDAGLDPEAAGKDALDPAQLAGYVELHIEQGPVLLDAGLPLGVVTTISAGNRHTLTVKGVAGHAGTVPMKMRHDALTAAAEMVLVIEKRAGAGALVATVGILRVHEGSSNVIPGHVDFTLDIRAGDDATRRAAEDDIFTACEVIAKQRGVVLTRVRQSESKVVRCSEAMQLRIAEAITAAGVEARRLPSGAGHDAMMLAEICETGMMFVRCGAGGVSHNPAETVSVEDAGLAVRALLELIRRFPPAA
ncbi:allantoate amidohydrolase [Usitatibacter palustris]|uniref:N-carbamoyl-L-amino acid hydrolase n=1 Tax=Usitatibacter palustris TaxID=2732487 RepID=A0A6M4H5V9_9PROT|nr:allantoate amidohydrolase [Usitatibacter palustris]QJR14043.1 N-carbamoyl-L-amino acid hydrolase [Usitatibacter palustris]